MFSISFLCFVSSFPQATAVVLANHTSTTYDIYFQYPSDWELTERTNRFQEGSDISIQKIVSGDIALITIGYIKETLDNFDSDTVTRKTNAYHTEMLGNYEKETRSIEEPSFVTIDGVKAGTFVIAEKDRFDEDSIDWGIQAWLVYFANKSYFITFSSPTSMFDSQQKTEVRDNFIKSIKFLDKSKSPTSNRILGDSLNKQKRFDHFILLHSTALNVSISI